MPWVRVGHNETPVQRWGKAARRAVKRRRVIVLVAVLAAIGAVLVLGPHILAHGAIHAAETPAERLG